MHELPMIGRFFRKPKKATHTSVSRAARPLNPTEMNAAKEKYVKPKFMKPDVKPGGHLSLWGVNSTSSWTDAVIKRISIGEPVPNSRKRKIDFVFESEGKENIYPREAELAESYDMVPLGIHFMEAKGVRTQFLVVGFAEKKPRHIEELDKEGLPIIPKYTRTMAYELNEKLPILMAKRAEHYY